MKTSQITRLGRRLAWFFLPLICVATVAQTPTRFSYKPPAGYVPDGATAIRLAVAVWEPIYGQKQIASEAPYSAQLKDGVWLVEGHLPKGWVGGVAEIEIAKDTGEILRMSHGK